MSTVRRTTGLVVLAVALAAAATQAVLAAEGREELPPGAKLVGLTVEPASLALRSRYDYAQVLITGRLESGETIDATRMAVGQPSADIATVSASGLVRAKADGRADLVWELAGQKATVPIEVAGAGAELHVDYVRDVTPVLSKMGCNQGTCHGSKEGKNGFKLSLRGYDPLYDVRALTDDHAARRINRASPENSLMLLKAIGAVPHVGGQLTRTGEPYYEIVRAWIADGLPLVLTTPKVTGIQLSPQNPIVARENMKQQMRVLATYADGTMRDVTAEAFVETGNQDVAITDKAGLVTALRRGEAPMLAPYEGAYAATTVTVMGDREGFVWQQPPSFNYIDDLVYAKLQRTKTSVSPLATDDQFVRRVYLDLTGLPPQPEELRRFLADPRDSKTKRDELIDRLVGSAPFVEHWTNKWADLLQVNSKYLGAEGATSFRNWIKQAVASNMPYDQFSNAILTASGSNHDNPAAAYYKILRVPDETMENTTHLFLAVRFNCNKCHDHPFERWTQDQYYNLAAYFAQFGLKKDPASGDRNLGGTAVEGAKPLYEVVFDSGAGEVKHDRTGQVSPPAFPYPSVHDEPAGASRRELLARWITSKDNQYFARSYANRLWGYLLGVGIIEPIDDIRAGNPASNPELLDRLTAQFIGSGFDVQDLLRTICKSRTYQLSIGTDKWNVDDSINYSHALARRLSAEVLFDSVHAATGSLSRLPGLPVGARAAELADGAANLPSGFLDQFGKPARESSCECERANNVMLGPVMALINGATVSDAIADPNNSVTKLVAAEADDGRLVEELFVRVLSRAPTPMEREAGIAAVQNAGADAELAQAKLAEYRQQLPAKLAAWEASLNKQASWTVLDPTEMTSSFGATFTKENGAVLVGGANGKGTYTIVARTDLKGITGFKLEALADDRLPAKGPGRAPNGNLVLNELTVQAAPAAQVDQKAAIGLQNGQADFSQDGFSAAAAIDGNAGSGWALAPQFGKDHAAVFETKADAGGDGGTILTFVLDQQYADGQHTLGKFRLSATTSPRPLRLDGGLPPEIAALVAVPADQRNDQQRAVLLDLYRKTDPVLVELEQAAQVAQAQLANRRLIGAQDLVWALVNSPAFLFNR